MNAQTDTHTDIPADDAPDGDDVSNVAARILDEMPAPQEHAIAQAAEPSTDAPASDPAPSPAHVFGELDASGTAWNPEVHATGADGKGVKTAKGLWRRRRGVSAGRASIVGAPSRAADPPAEAQAVQARAAGAACAHTLFMLGQAFGGKEWAPRQNESVNEVTMMEKAFGDYFVAKGYTEFPPGLALSIAVSAYALPRFAMPETRSRMTRAKQWIAAKYIAWKDRKKAKATREIGREDSQK